jgi:alanine racemase
MGPRSLTSKEGRQAQLASEDWLSRPLWAEIDLDAIANNVTMLKAHAGPAELMAMVKANAYGHGAVRVSHTALKAGASRLGVATLDEAIQLRRGGIQSPILLVGPIAPEQAPRAVQLDITVTVTRPEVGEALSTAAQACGTSCAVHVKVDTGLNRYGLAGDEATQLASALRELPGLVVEGIYTHFASADESDKSFTHAQVEDFLRVADTLDWIPLRHCSNSAGLIDLPAYSFNLVRPGISIYGLYPSQDVERRIKLTPALTLKARLTRVHRMAAGGTTSYGRRWQAHGGERVALVPCGYGDGYPRLLSNRFHVWADGQQCPIRGTIAMDQMIVDITSTTLGLNDEVTVLGGADGTGISASEVAAAASTINYEITTAIAARVPRIFIEDGEPVAVQGLNDSLPVTLRS